MIEPTTSPSLVSGTLATPASPAYRAKAAEAAEKFEAHFIAQVFKQMRQATREMSDDDGSFAKHGNDDMLAIADNMVADTLAHRRAFGIADILLRQLLPVKESAPAVASSVGETLSEKTPSQR
jgi:flagellar protein FlgJ